MDAYILDGMRILKLRSIYGPAEWRGKFNYRDRINLKNEIKDAIGYQRHSWNDGIFYVTFRDFVEFFEIVNICHLRKSHSLSTLEDIVCSHNQVAYYQFYINNTNGKKLKKLIFV